MNNIYTKELTPELWNDFESYFEFGSCSGCWCMNHRLPVGLDFDGEAAKLAMKQLVESKRVFGVLAYVDGDEVPVGWASLDRRKTLPGHDCIADDIDCDASIWSIHCVTARNDHKGTGVEAILMEAAVALSLDFSATAVEAYPEPRSKDGEFRTWNTFSGTHEKFEALGFTENEKNYGDHAEFFHPMTKKI